MAIENATRARPFVVPLVKNWASPEGEPVDEFPHVLEDTFSHDEIWPQPYDLLYVSLRSGRSVGKNGNTKTELIPQADTEPVDELEVVDESIPADLEDDEPMALRVDEASNELPD